jgi:hypothetical protein
VTASPHVRKDARGRARGCAIAVTIVVCGSGLSGVGSASGKGEAGPVSTIYVADGASHEVTPLETSAGVAGRPILLGALSPVALAVAPGAKTLYVVADGSDVNGSPGSAIPISTATDTPGKPIAAGIASQAISIMPNGEKAFVLNGIDAATTSEATPATVTPIDLATLRPLAPIKVGTLPQSMTMSPNGKLLYVVDSSQSDVGEPIAITPVDTATDTAGPEIKLSKASVPFPASGIVFTSNSRTAYAITASGVVPITTATGAVGKVIGLRTANPVAIAVIGDGSSIAEVGTPVTALVPQSPYTDNVTLAVVSAATGDVGKVARLGNEPGAIAWQVAITPDGSTAYVLVITSPPRESLVIPVDLTTGNAGKPIDAGRNAFSIAISPNGDTAYVLDGGAFQGVGSAHDAPGAVLPIATATDTVGKAISVGIGPTTFAIASAREDQVENLTATPSLKRQLVAAFAVGWHLRVSEVAGTAPGSVYYSFDKTTRTYWAEGSFVPAKGDPPAMMQDAGAFGVFSRTTGGAWKFVGSSLPIACEELSVVPTAILALWAVPSTDAKYCRP